MMGPDRALRFRHARQPAARMSFVGAGLAVLYAFHFVVLRNEDYALLLGSLLFFGALAAVMSVTRRIDWYATGRPGAGGGNGA